MTRRNNKTQQTQMPDGAEVKDANVAAEASDADVAAEASDADVAAEASDAFVVLIPYVKPTKTPDSLEIVIRAWQKNAQFPVRLVIIGDKPDFDIEGIDVEHVSAPTGNPHVHIEVCRGIQEFISKEKCARFILAHDDEVPLQPFMPADLKATAFREFPELDPASDNFFISDMARTVEKLKEMSINPIFFSGHAPHVYDSEVFLQMIEDYELTEVGFDYEVLYFCTKHIEPVYLDNPFDNGYSFLIMQFDELDRVKDRLATHQWCSFGGSCTSQVYYDTVAKYLES